MATPIVVLLLVRQAFVRGVVVTGVDR